jgi:hypothetical protein
MELVPSPGARADVGQDYLHREAAPERAAEVLRIPSK